ncbi:3-isopropylmalate dehydratase small subunit [Thalassotalea ponticola]|uniref:3-isopropylmalate dehydratase small subunit n=1 Tax=Thalassotalea ponticola TaxID=1523392 RepID=UPI0025B5D887|nr:3-isopropylmalate dehydratase small subunit [Thalassotalea ponticola]MDN3651960.1 3-isopropylmalate dehydratase small subunit [Thalassotalea ponticola]
MQKFSQHTGYVVAIDRANIDTDQIIPKQFLQKTTRTGFADHLFHDWRYLDELGEQPNSDFVLNKPENQGASILLSRENFGCGSSREHAPWAIQEYGFKAVIATSFADIFFANCINIGLLPVALPEHVIDYLFQQTSIERLQLTVDLINSQVILGQQRFDFTLTEFQRYCLLNGVDAVGWTLKKQDKIDAFERNLPIWQ